MVLVLAVAGLQACLSPPPRSRPTALGELWHIHLGVQSFAADHGRLPRAIEELHDESAPARYVGGRGLRDSWGRAIRYRLIPGEYELRSAGPDGVFESGDDLVFVPSQRQAQVDAFAGCYAVSLEWAPGFPGQRMALDTAGGAAAGTSLSDERQARRMEPRGGLRVNCVGRWPARARHAAGAPAEDGRRFAGGYRPRAEGRATAGCRETFGCMRAIADSGGLRCLTRLPG